MKSHFRRKLSRADGGFKVTFDQLIDVLADELQGGVEIIVEFWRLRWLRVPQGLSTKLLRSKVKSTTWMKCQG